MKTVLLVDDSTTMLMSMKAGLEISGFQVEVAGDGEQAMQKLDTGLKPDLIITDIHMPRMDGIEFIRQARRKLRFTPILALTADGRSAIVSSEGVGAPLVTVPLPQAAADAP